MCIHIDFDPPRSFLPTPKSGGNSMILYESKSITITNLSGLAKYLLFYSLMLTFKFFLDPYFCHICIYIIYLVSGVHFTYQTENCMN